MSDQNGRIPGNGRPGGKWLRISKQVKLCNQHGKWPKRKIGSFISQKKYPGAAYDPSETTHRIVVSPSRNKIPISKAFLHQAGVNFVGEFFSFHPMFLSFFIGVFCRCGAWQIHLRGKLGNQVAILDPCRDTGPGRPSRNSKCPNTIVSRDRAQVTHAIHLTKVVEAPSPATRPAEIGSADSTTSDPCRDSNPAIFIAKH